MDNSFFVPRSDLTFIVFDLTWLFWTKRCEKLSLERNFGHAEEAF